MLKATEAKMFVANVDETQFLTGGMGFTLIKDLTENNASWFRVYTTQVVMKSSPRERV